jgi:hypothetical protein
VDGIHFTPVGRPVKAQGSVAAGHTYSWIDHDVLPMAQYRIKGVDLNLYETLSNIVIIRNTPARMFYVLENPALSTIRMQVNHAGAFRLQLANAQGQVLYRSSHPATGGGEVKVPVNGLSKGVYWLSVYPDGETVQTFKIILQ